MSHTRTHTRMYTHGMRTSGVAFPTAALSVSTHSHKQARSRCCAIKRAFVSHVPLQSHTHTLISTHACKLITALKTNYKMVSVKNHSTLNNIL